MKTSHIALGFLVGLGLGCAASNVASQSDPIPPAPLSLKALPQGGVITWDDAQVRTAPNNAAIAHLYTTGKEAFVGHLTIQPNAGVPEHADPTEEFIYVLEGAGTIFINGTAHAVTPKSLIYMPAHANVRFTNGDAVLKAVQIFANPGPEAKYTRWTATAP